jgi:hypothetical protein
MQPGTNLQHKRLRVGHIRCPNLDHPATNLKLDLTVNPARPTTFMHILLEHQRHPLQPESFEGRFGGGLQGVVVGELVHLGAQVGQGAVVLVEGGVVEH